MINFFSGLPGDGKSMNAMRNACRILGTTDCTLVTNLPITDGLHEYVQAKYPNAKDTQKRVRQIKEPNEVLNFFRFRSGGLVLPCPDEFGLTAGKDKLGESKFLELVNDYFSLMNDGTDDHRRGVLYIIDETHDYFNVRRWAAIADLFDWYLSKHRHFQDEVYFLSQKPDKVAKGLRDLVGRWSKCKNYYGKFWYLWKRKGRFEVKHWDDEITGKPDNTEVFKMDFEGIASTYDTHGATNVHSTGGINERRKFGLPWWSLPLGITIIALVAVFSAWKLGSFGLTALFDTSASKALGQASKSMASDARASVKSDDADSLPNLITGFIDFDGKRIFVKRDGTNIHPREYESFRSDSVTLKGGKVIKFANFNRTIGDAIQLAKSRQELRLAYSDLSRPIHEFYAPDDPPPSDPEPVTPEPKPESTGFEPFGFSPLGLKR